MKLKPNNIYQGDCLELMKDIPDNSIDLVLTDPPYGINFIPQREESRKKFGKIPIENDEIIGKEWVKWFMPICKECYRVLKDNSVSYYFSGFNPYYYYYYCLLECGFEIKANIIWVKNNFGLGYHFRRQYEQILVGFKGDVKKPKKAMSDVIFEKKVDGTALMHSCQKPKKLIKILINQYTKYDDLILDPFLGSGTTAVACKELGRKYIGIEINKEYIDITNERLRKTKVYNVEYF